MDLLVWREVNMRHVDVSFWQVEDGTSVNQGLLGTTQRDGFHQYSSNTDSLLVVTVVHRLCDGVSEFIPVAERPDTQKLDQRVELVNLVLDRSCSYAPSVVGVEQTACAGSSRLLVLDGVCFVQYDSVKGDLVEGAQAGFLEVRSSDSIG